MNNKKIAILSGKGGTGKTLVSVNLSVVEKTSTYVDFDVEEPNGYLFLKPKNSIKKNVEIMVPVVDNNLCTGCKKCVEFCKFNALAYTNKLMIFEELCHSCGGCTFLCPENALTEKQKIIGTVEIGKSDDVTVLTGTMNPGESSGVPIIKKLLSHITDSKGYVFLDCPPGSSCAVMESIKDVDYCVLVAEPTIFGLHNLKMVHELVNIFHKPFGIVLNKCTDAENPSEVFCKENNLNILAKIPFDKELGRINSNAEIIVNKSKKYNELFSCLLNKIKEEACK